MGLPNILIEFKKKADTAIRRGERGIVAVLVIDSIVGITKLKDKSDIPSGLNAANKAYAERAFMGGENPVKHVWLVVSDSIDNGLAALEPYRFDYLACPPDISSEDAQKAAAFIKDLRDNKHIKVKAVLPNTAADHEGIINLTTGDIKVGNSTFTAAEYCSRIASLLAGTSLQHSATYHVLTEVTDVPKHTKKELDTKIDAGEFVLFHDGEKVKVGRAVNSLVKVSEPKSKDYQYIKIVDIMDMIYMDIKRTCEDNYVGKYPNNYDNKCNLIVAVQAYLEGLRKDEILDGKITAGIDLEAQTKYLKAQGEPVEDMSEQEIKEANTKTYVFIRSGFHILNAIEDITVNFYI